MKRKALIIWPLFIIAAVFLIFKFFSANKLNISTASFQQLPGWSQANVVKSFKAFKYSCQYFNKLAPSTSVGTKRIGVKAKDWYPACKAAKQLRRVNQTTTKDFFIHWMKPYALRNSNHKPGLFTGYFLAQINGRLSKSKRFSVPIYGRPNNLITFNLGDFDPALGTKHVAALIKSDGRLIPYPFTRANINAGKINHHSRIVAWTDSKIARYLLQVEGSGYLRLANGNTILLNYAGSNGKHGILIGRVLVKQGMIKLNKSTGDKIKHWLLTHPKKAEAILNKNQSFVFFQRAKSNNTFGNIGVPLTAEYSLAVDPSVVPLGAPVWLTTVVPNGKPQAQPRHFRRLMMAQDVGGAIKGNIRGDVFWGKGNKAEFKANHMASKGQYWIFLPKTSHVT